MSPRKVPTSYLVIELVRKAISTPYVRASDAAVARALEIKPGTVGGYKSGKDVMGLATLAKADDLVHFNRQQLAELQVGIAMDKASGPDELRVLEALREAIHRLPATSILLACVAAFGHSGDAFALEKQAFSRIPAPSGNCADSVYYGKSRRRRRAAGLGERFARFLNHFPVPPLLTDQRASGIA